MNPCNASADHGRHHPSGEILERLKSLYPKSIDLTLNRPRRLLAELDNPENRLPPVIHFAGTNGKGSTLSMVRAGLEGAGRSVHSYISPHLTKFNERITLAGEVIDEDALVRVLLECEMVNSGKPISLFEITTAAAMLAFSRSRADHLLLEVGLGGRLDATNVVERPDLTVITPVSMDHEQYLGNELSAIATEKAGILKPGVDCIVTRQQPDALRAIEQEARMAGSRILLQDRDWAANIINGRLRYSDPGIELDLPLPNLVGPHQTINAGAAIAVLRQLDMDLPAMEAAVSRARWPGRMQRLQQGPLIDAAPDSEVWLDGGHNPAAGHALAESLRAMPQRATRIICGMLDTKDIRGFLSALHGIADRLYGIAIPDEAASLPAAQVANMAREVGFSSDESAGPVHAARTIATEQPDARILICGSLYLAGHVLQNNS